MLNIAALYFLTSREQGANFVIETFQVLIFKDFFRFLTEDSATITYEYYKGSSEQNKRSRK